MIHPVVSFLFDLMLLGTAASVIAAMVAEYLGERESAVGSTRVHAPVARHGMYARQRSLAHQRRRAMSRSAGLARRAA